MSWEFLALLSFIQFASKFSTLEQEEHASAAAVAAEVLSAIKTVVAFGGEEKEAIRWVN